MARLARLWALSGLSLLLLASTCYDVAAEVAAEGGGSVDERLLADDQETHKRESRGILLRSWRNIHTRNKEQPQPAPLTDNSNVYARQWIGRQSDSVPIMLSNLPVAMKFALLQRLTGHDKRTPNSRAFLGMRGKKDEDLSGAAWDLDEEDVETSSRIKKPFGPDRFVGTRGKKDPLGSRFYGVRGKKIPNKFLGMRGKKSVGVPIVEFDESELSKRASNLFNSFVGMRGKKDLNADDDAVWPLSEVDAIIEEQGDVVDQRSSQLAKDSDAVRHE